MATWWTIIYFWVGGALPPSRRCALDVADYICKHLMKGNMKCKSLAIWYFVDTADIYDMASIYDMAQSYDITNSLNMIHCYMAHSIEMAHNRYITQSSYGPQQMN